MDQDKSIHSASHIVETASFQNGINQFFSLKLLTQHPTMTM